MTRSMLSGCVLLLACNAAPVEVPDEDSLGGTDTLDSGDASDLPTPSGCDPSACATECGHMYDECASPMIGTCSDADTCECSEGIPCLPCAEQQCEWYEQCGTGDSPEYGHCTIHCVYWFEYFWAPELGCTIALPPDTPNALLPIFKLYVADMMPPRTDACDDPDYLDSWVLDEQTLLITLCGETCSSFESAGELTTGWDFPCE